MERVKQKSEWGEQFEEIASLLSNRKYEEALKKALQLSDDHPDTPEVTALAARAYLENDMPKDAMEYADLAVKQSGEDDSYARLKRAYVLLRLGIYPGAIHDLDYVINKNNEFLSDALKIKARCFAGSADYEEALKIFERALKEDKSHTDTDRKMLELYKNAAGKGSFLKKLKGKDASLLEEANEAVDQGELWYAIWAVKQILEEDKLTELHPEARILELEAMYELFQYSPAFAKAEKFKDDLGDNKRFKKIYKKLVSIERKKIIEQEQRKYQQQLNEEKDTQRKKDEKPVLKKEFMKKPKEYRTDFVRNKDTEITALNSRTFEYSADTRPDERSYLLEFDSSKVSYIGVETIVANTFFQKEDKTFEGRAVWYLNGKEIGEHKFDIEVRSEWDKVIFTESWGSENSGYWKKGQARVDIYLEDEKVCERWFIIGDEEIVNDESFDAHKTGGRHSTAEVQSQSHGRQKSAGDASPKSLEQLLKELDSFIGLENVKQTMRDFVDYLKFIKERKESGLQTQEGISLHTIFLGNPGTGKTTVARLLGGIFREMGLLESGHVVETDRSGLVGQYVGETAQKTDKLIQDSIGGVLFIDEAYTLTKQEGSGQDFGQEAIDTLLKRMEDHADDFAVIAAGYPEEMEGFLNSNPGIKSRFNHTFNFDDYNPDELIDIFKLFAKKEDYSLAPDAEELLKKEFKRAYRDRDKTFGNARLVRNIFNEAKMQLSKRYLKLQDGEKTREALTTITADDIKPLFRKAKEDAYKIGIDEAALQNSLDELNTLAGLDSVKKSVDKLISSIKVAKMREQRGMKVMKKNLHAVFYGNPGTGKTTVARLLSEIYKQMGLLEKGHLVEVDRSGLVAGYSGQTAEKTDNVIQDALGGTLFIDEAYALSRGNDDFGQEAIDTLLKRMEDYKDNLVVIAAGYPEEMKAFLDSNPGLESRFTNYFDFEDYSPAQLIEIAKVISDKNGYKLSPDAERFLVTMLSDLYENRDDNFGNARTVRNILYKAIGNQEERILEIEDPSDDDLMMLTEEDFKQIDLSEFRD